MYPASSPSTATEQSAKPSHSVLYQQRRQRLSQQMQPNSLAIVPAASISYRNNDVENPWRQASHFDYLTGIDEADALAIIKNTNPTQLIIFCQAKDPQNELWQGAGIGCQAMCQQHGADQAFELEQLDEQMPKLLQNINQVYYDWDQSNSVNDKLDKRLKNWINQLAKNSRFGISAPQSLHFLNPLLGELRLIKDEFEIACMRKAATISVLAHRQAMKKALTCTNEKQVADWLDYSMLCQGSERSAFGSIVAAGANACTLHYRQNNKDFNKQQLMLIDAGAEYLGYASDITTCFPLGGRFSEPQKCIYEAVLKAHQATLAACRVGISMQDLQQISVLSLSQSLLDLKLLTGSLEEVIEQKRYQRFYMHRIGHWIGKDVHDVGNYLIGGQWRPLQANMLITIEPGLYIQADSDIPKKFHNLGVRIEDTILITDQGYQNLSADLPRTVSEIETFLNQS